MFVTLIITNTYIFFTLSYACCRASVTLHIVVNNVIRYLINTSYKTSAHCKFQDTFRVMRDESISVKIRYECVQC